MREDALDSLRSSRDVKGEQSAGRRRIEARYRGHRSRFTCHDRGGKRDSGVGDGRYDGRVVGAW